MGNLRRFRDQTRGSWLGADPLPDSRYEAVYVHYDRHGTIHDYVYEQLRMLVAAGFRITFVSNAPKFSEECVAETAIFCRQILWRHNTGYGFGAYKDGVTAVGDLDKVDRLLFMNDSVYGPFYPLTKTLATIDPLQTDFWGITDSWEHAYHIHSYFMIFLKGALQSPQFRDFWRGFPYVNKKEWIIRWGEIELTQRLVQHGLRASVLAPYWEVAKIVLTKINSVTPHTPAHKEFIANISNYLVRGTPMNSTHFFWDTIVVDFSCPFLNCEVIKHNPAGIPLIWQWPETIGRNSEYDLSLIERHLRVSYERKLVTA